MGWKRTGFWALCLSMLSSFALAQITLDNLNDQEVDNGATVVLNCILRGARQSDSLILFWYHETTAVSFNDALTVVNPRYKLNTSPFGQWKLTIQNAQRSDQGKWRCQLQSPLAVMEEMKLVVRTPPSIEYITPNMSPMPGSTVRLSCNATGSPEPTIQWQRLQPVPIFPQPLGGAYYTGRELVIDDITGEWRGLYQCLASNSVAPQVTEQVFLQMEYAPTVEVKDGVVSAPRQESANLVCICKAFPAVRNINDINWFKGNDQVVVSDGYQISLDLDLEMDPNRETTVSTLVVGTVNDDTLGEYTCRFENLLGNAEARVTLGVSVKIDPDTGKSTSKASTIMAAIVINMVFIAIATALGQF
ncbi:lachesin-like isoform X1 [Asterias rubens]|uniref:lachesin-like isoform X1 n=1 Tax=Asterias rubens TaxID=7604 RepID=UPI001454F17F|nr:lachesin-like isoform X1 [Asterias rubens]